MDDTKQLLRPGRVLNVTAVPIDREVVEYVDRTAVFLVKSSYESTYYVT